MRESVGRDDHEFYVVLDQTKGYKPEATGLALVTLEKGNYFSQESHAIRTEKAQLTTMVDGLPF